MKETNELYSELPLCALTKITSTNLYIWKHPLNP